MTTDWLLMVPMALELALPLMPLSQPMPTSALHLDSGSCALTVELPPAIATIAAASTHLPQLIVIVRSSFRFRFSQDRRQADAGNDDWHNVAHPRRLLAVTKVNHPFCSTELHSVPKLDVQSPNVVRVGLLHAVPAR